MGGVDEAREWVGGRITFPVPIESMGDRRAEMSLWVELPDLQVVGQVLEDPERPAASFGQSLMRAMSSPLVGTPRRPRRVRVADETLARELQSFSFLSVEVAPTPELDKVVRSLSAFFGSGSYFSDPSLTPEDVAAFFRAASALWAARPWTLVDDDALVHIAIPELDVDDGCLSIVGALDQVRGFVFFPSYDDYESMAASAASATQDTPLASHSALYFSFDARNDVSEAMREEVREHGWSPPDEDAYPMLMRLADGKPAPVFEGEVRLATTIMRALAACVASHPEAFESFGEVEVRESYFDDDDLETIVTVPHPDAELEDEMERPPRAKTLGSENPYGLALAPGKLEELERSLGAFSLHRVMGMFCAVASVPRVVSPQEWISEIFDEVKFADEAHFRATVDALMLGLNHAVSVLAEDDIDALVPEEDDEEACRLWARGYASVLRTVDPAHTGGDIFDAMLAIETLAETPEILKRLDEVRGDRTREAMLALYRDSLADDAAFLFEAWTDARENPPDLTIRRTSPKVGRNDPCPCGSGKKHKKCCALL